MLVVAVVTTALLAYSGQLLLLFSRRSPSRIWGLLQLNALCCWVIRLGWMWLVLFERPEWYDKIPLGGWVILAAQLTESMAMWRLSYRVVRAG